MIKLNVKTTAMKYKLVIFTILLFASCSTNEVKPVANQVLLSSELKLTQSVSTLKTLIGLSGYKLPLDKLQQDVDLYKVTYKTTYLNNQSIIASGLVILPKTSGSYPMVSFQHGTIAAHTEAPSVLPTADPQLILFSALAAPGLIGVVPDYIGFGSSSNVLHPYYNRDLTASAVIDLLKAAKELAREKNIQFNGKLFLSGYSEGGYATMAAHRELEKNPLEGFDLIASFPAAGGYDVKAMQEYLFKQDTYNDPFYIAYVASAYRTSYGWTAPVADFFKEPYATRIPTLFDGTKSGGQINSQLINVLPELITPDLLANIDTNVKYKYIVDAFNLNSLTDWAPTKKMYMYHGDADTTVPYTNSTITYDKLIAKGASTTNLTLTAFLGKDHGTGVRSYFESFVPVMLDLR
jgi:hypothetical protein